MNKSILPLNTCTV